MRATRARLVGGLGVLSFVALLIIPAAAAATPGKILLRGPVQLNGVEWIQEIVATDGARDSVTMTLSRRLQNKSYRLREAHRYSFPNLDPDTVILADDLTGSIELGAPQTAGLLSMNVDLVKIAGKKPSSLCGGDLRRRRVNIAAGSDLSLDSLNNVFGAIEGFPETGRFIVERGRCDTKPPCKTLSRALIGVASRELLGGLNESLRWEKRHTFVTDKTTIDVSLSRELALPLGTAAGTFVASLRGTLANASVGPNATTFNADGLPRLSGEAVVADLGPVQKGPYINCTKYERYRLEQRKGTQSGNLAFKPTGIPSTSIALGWTTSSGMREFVDWTEIGPPMPPIKP